MTEHRGTSFAHSCVKVPVDPYSRQPTPSYERPRSGGCRNVERHGSAESARRISFDTGDPNSRVEAASPRETLENFMEFLESIPDYGDVHHLTNEQFKQKLDYLKRKQRVLLKNLRNCLEEDNAVEELELAARSHLETGRVENENYRAADNELSLKGKRCNFQESRIDSPALQLFSSGRFAGLAEDQDLLTYRCKDRDKDAKTLRNKQISSARKSWSPWSESKSVEESIESDADGSIETRSLPPSSPKRWHPTVPKPFSFTLREDAEKYMTLTEMQAEERFKRGGGRRGTTVKRHFRPVPLTSKIPLYNKLLAEKEERSRMVREESAWNLMSQVRPFKLECARRALTRSSPELHPVARRRARSTPRFKAKPVPKNLFCTDVYDRMLEDEYYRTLQKKIRSAEMLHSSSLPPSMAARERVKSATTRSNDCKREFVTGERTRGGRESTGASVTPLPSERSRCGITSTILSTRGNNLASVLRCQASREKMQREIQERMEERQREEAMRMREYLLRRKPAWRALRAAARHEHERDLELRASLRRDEAREQAERHRLQMELMLGRVTQIPTLFERHSQVEEYLQSFQTALPRPPKACAKVAYKPKKKKNKNKKTKRNDSSSGDSYESVASSSRPDSGSFTSSSSSTLASIDRSSKSSESRKSERSNGNSTLVKKKGDRGPLKVSINETAELIEDQNMDDQRSSSDQPTPSVVECGGNESESENISARN